MGGGLLKISLNLIKYNTARKHVHVVRTRITEARIASVSNLNVFRYARSTSSNWLLIRSELMRRLDVVKQYGFHYLRTTFKQRENRSILIRIAPRIHLIL